MSVVGFALDHHVVNLKLLLSLLLHVKCAQDGARLAQGIVFTMAVPGPTSNGTHAVQGPSQVYPWMLTHPLEALQPVQIMDGSTKQPHNNIIWTDIRVPYVVTSCPHSSSHKQVSPA